MPVTRLRMRIKCAVCNKPVDEWVMWGNPADMSRRIKVRCHGEEDSMEMTWGFLADLTPDEMRRLERSEGVAFTTKRLPRPSASEAER